MSSNLGVSVEATSSFPNPAQDYYRGPVSLDQHFIPHPATTFFLRVSGDGLRSRGILDGDTLIVDRALEAQRGHIVIMVIDNEYRLGVFTTLNGYAQLANDHGYEALSLGAQLWGVVTACVHHLATPS